MGHRILLAVPQVTDQDGLETFLARLGYEIVVAADARAAIEAALAGRFDLLIVAVPSSEFCGDFFDRLRAVQPDLEILVLAAPGDQNGVRDCLRFSLTPEHILVQPAESAQVMKRVIGILGPPAPVR